MSELEEKLSRVQVGDEVFNYTWGWQKVIEIKHDETLTYPLVTGKDRTRCFMRNGRYQESVNSNGFDLTDVRLHSEKKPQAIGSAEIQDPPFKNARVGDMVWCSDECKMVRITATESSDCGYPIVAGSHCYGYDGFKSIHKIAPRIYWQAPTNIPPERKPEPISKEEFIDYSDELRKIHIDKGIACTSTYDNGNLSFWSKKFGAVSCLSDTARDEIEEMLAATEKL